MKRLDTDFCVIGGGLAGVCAALAAARNGTKVVLVQDRSVLGGNASSEIKMHIVGADCHGARPGARETGLLEEFRLEDACRNPHRSYSMWDLLLYEKVKENPNITLLLDSDCIGCETEEREGRKFIKRAYVTRNLTEDKFVIEASYFADCSGDGGLGNSAGAEFRMGREAQSEYDESLALPVADQQTLGNSILFTARKHATPQPFIRPAWVRKFEPEDLKLRKPNGYEYGYWWAEWGGQLDTIKDNEEIRHELLRITLGVWDYIKNSGNHPDSENWALEWVGALPGKRESRRFLGEHVLTQGDIESGRIFEDQVAYGGWWLDLHPPSGVDAIDERPCVQHHLKSLYSIPLRALYSKDVLNLFFAGRNISATHVAFASTRVMGTCAVMGQAIGTAAAVCAKKSSGRPEAIGEVCQTAVLREIQQTLLRDDAFLLGVANEDPLDLARNATCTASSSRHGGEANNVVNGITRPVRTDWSEWLKPNFNGWESETLPATLELKLQQPAKVREIHLTFCTGLQRELTLSASDYLTSKIVRGPQPETVKDYDIYLDDRLVESVRGNYLRKRVHRFTAAAGQRVKIEVLATHGLEQARIFEVRVYPA